MKRILTFAVMAAAILSAGAKTLWTGNCTFANYQVESGDRPIFTPEDFDGVVIGDKLIFHITNNTADPQSWHQVELWMWDGEKPGPNALGLGVHILDGMTTAEFTIDETLLSGLRGGMTCAAGTGYTVRSIDVTTFDGLIWEGECLCPNWVPNPAVTLPGANFAVAQEGDVLVFTVEKINAGEWAAIQIDKASTFSAGPFDKKEIADGQTEVRIVLNAELLASLVTDGINITGANFILRKIELVSGNGEGGEGGDDNDNVIWSGTMTVTSWDNTVTLGGDAFGNLQAGDRFAFTVTAGDADSSIAIRTNPDWGDIPSDNPDGDYIYLVNGPGVYYWEINAEAAEEINTNGVVITGTAYTLTKIEIQDAPVEDTAIWSGSMTAGDWQQSLVVEASKLAFVSEGTILTFTVSAADADAQISLKSNLPEGWGEMPSNDGEYGNYIHITDGPGVYYFTVNAEAAVLMKEYGMVVAGLGYTLTQVGYVEDSGVKGVVFTTAGNAVYNLNGVKVADSLENVKEGGLYITAGKKVIVK